MLIPEKRQFYNSQMVICIILGFGNEGDPELSHAEFPTQESLKYRQDFKPDNQRLADEEVNDDYIAPTQNLNSKDTIPLPWKEDTREHILGRKFCGILRLISWAPRIAKIRRSWKWSLLKWRQEQANLISAAVIKLFLQVTLKDFVLLIVWN